MTTRRKTYDTATVADRREQVSRMLIGGRMTQREIAKALGNAVSTINSDCKALLKNWQATAESQIALYAAQQLEGLDRLEGLCWGSLEAEAMSGEMSPFTAPKAANVLIKCFERKARLLGLDRIVETAVSGDVEIRVIYGSSKSREEKAHA